MLSMRWFGGISLDVGREAVYQHMNGKPIGHMFLLYTYKGCETAACEADELTQWTVMSMWAMSWPCAALLRCF